MIENAAFSNRVSRMLGLSLDSWNNIMVSLLTLAAGAALLAAVATYVVIRLQKQESLAATAALEKYKIDAKADADIKINGAREEARTQNKLLEKATADAQSHAADANTAAADANTRAAEIMKATAWRQFNPEQQEKIAAILAKKPGKVVLAWISNDSESLSLAVQLSQLLSNAHWEMTWSSRTYSNRLIWGIVIPSSDRSESAQLLRDALTNAGAHFFPDEIPQPDMFFGPQTPVPPDACLILIGSKKPTFAWTPD